MEPKEVERLVKQLLIEDAFGPMREPGTFYVSELAACPRRAALNVFSTPTPCPWSLAQRLGAGSSTRSYRRSLGAS